MLAGTHERRDENLQKTQNYNLNKPEVTDPLRLADFNQNADILDAALGALVGRSRVVVGSFIGDNTSKRTQNLGFTPQFILILSKYNGKPYLTVATANIGVVLTDSGFFADDSRCVEGGVYICTTGNNSKDGNYYLAVE